MTDRQAAEARERAEAYLKRASDEDSSLGEWAGARFAPDVVRLCDAVDALSVRLAQVEARERAERDLREIADRERDKAQDRWAQAEQERDEWKERAGYERGRLTVAEVRLREYEEDAELALAGIPDPMHPSLREWEKGLVCAQVLVAHLAGHDDPGNVESARAALAASGGREAPDTKEPTDE